MATKTLDERLHELVAPLQQELEQLQTHRQFLINSHEAEVARLRDEHRQAKMQVDEDIRKLNAALRPLGAVEPPKKKRKPASSGNGVSEERLDEGRKAIRGLVDEMNPFFTQPDLMKRMRLDQAKVSAVVKALEQEEFVGFVRWDDSTGRKRKQYRLMEGSRATANV